MSQICISLTTSFTCQFTRSRCNLKPILYLCRVTIPEATLVKLDRGEEHQSFLFVNNAIKRAGATNKEMTNTHPTQNGAGVIP